MKKAFTFILAKKSGYRRSAPLIALQMYLSADREGHPPINIEDGNGRRIANCISIDTETGEGIVCLDLTKPQEWPEQWHFSNFVGGSILKAIAKWKTPIRVFSRESGAEIRSELELAVVARFHSLGLRLRSTSERHKTHIEDSFIYLWAELGKAKAGIS